MTEADRTAIFKTGMIGLFRQFYATVNLQPRGNLPRIYNAASRHTGVHNVRITAITSLPRRAPYSDPRGVIRLACFFVYGALAFRVAMRVPFWWIPM